MSYLAFFRKRKSKLKNELLNKKKQAVFEWVLFMKQYYFMKQVYDKFNHRRNQILLKKKMIMSVRKIGRITRAFFKRRGDNKKERDLNTL